jgi:hypothetical protein
MTLVSCPRSSSHEVADGGHKQVTENKELVARIWGSLDMANFSSETLPQSWNVERKMENVQLLVGLSIRRPLVRARRF